MSVTIEALLAKHFRLNESKVRSIEPQHGRKITHAEAIRLTSHLSARQRAALASDALDALDAVFSERPRNPQKRLSLWESELTSLTAFRWWKQLRTPDRERVWMTIAVVWNVLERDRRLGNDNLGETEKRRWHVRSLCDVLAKKVLTFTAEQILIVIETSEKRSLHTHRREFDYTILSPIMPYFDAMRNSTALSQNDRSNLVAVREQLQDDGFGRDSRTAVAALNTILGEVDKDLFWDGEAWALEINETLRSMPPGSKANYVALLTHAGAVGFTKPSKGWFAAAQKASAFLAPAEGADRIAKWLETFTSSGRAELAEILQNGDDPFVRTCHDNRGRFESNLGYVTGVVYLARLFPTTKVISRLSDLVEQVSRWKHFLREQSFTAAAAAVRVFDMIDTDDAIAALSRVEMRVRWPKLRKLITKTLDGAITRRGASRDDIEEAVVPDFGMENGTLRLQVGDGHAVLAVGRGDRPTTAWHVPGKAPTHVVPRSLREQAPESVANIKSVATEIEKMHVAQRTRIDLLFRKPRHWSAEEWRTRYLDHGMLCGMSRRLIWQFDGTAAIWRDGSFEAADRRPIDWSKTAKVELWHPAAQASNEVVSWRERLEAMGIVQPIKQAHREVYLLTDAERRTSSYSNRFAAHVLKNHTTLAITQVRKWKMGLYGGASSPSLVLPGFGLRAEWWVNPAGEETDRLGFPLYLVSDQVRFYRDQSDEPMPLDQVPLLALSEVMRDVDLFVAIASVGNDPNWSDGGPDGRFRDYWQSYSFGDLSATAKTRREVLQKLIPRLKIADRCSFSDRFLIVKGSIRSYKIHLGSGNILMEPNNQYLCIVPDARTRAKGEGDLYLPFEGDNTLSIIISKALLLADDSKIEDPTITRQIRG